VKASNAHVRIEPAGAVLAGTRRSVRAPETSPLGVFYLPHYDAPGHPRVAWWYPSPSRGDEPLADYVALSPGRVDRATVDGEVVRARAGDFHGGPGTAG
jgi:uncharacterized protein (DUF427 family)